MHQRSRLKRLTGDLVGHLMSSQPTQFFIDERKQLLGGFRIACVHGTKQSGGVGHDPIMRSPRQNKKA